jgi:hypothetical protein
MILMRVLWVRMCCDKIEYFLWRHFSDRLLINIMSDKLLSSQLNQVSPPKDSIVESICAKFLKRSAVGWKKYGTTLDREDLSVLDWIEHAQEELMDGMLYLEKLKKSVSVAAGTGAGTGASAGKGAGTGASAAAATTAPPRTRSRAADSP